MNVTHTTTPRIASFATLLLTAVAASVIGCGNGDEAGDAGPAAARKAPDEIASDVPVTNGVEEPAEPVAEAPLLTDADAELAALLEVMADRSASPFND